ncbi:MAG: beta-ketoacyl-ACP synthase III [Bacteroidetes bacterium]|nr:MAG: beta-ketoacyl-ACP synthase III [Bacteroidota bacterium]
MRKVKITGLGLGIPAKKVSSEELEEKYGIPAGFSEKYSGVSSRYFAETESCAQLGALALHDAMRDAGITCSDLDLLISAAGSYDHPIPHQSALLKKEMNWGPNTIPVFDIDATCLSFVTALDVATDLIGSGRYRRIAIVSSEIASRTANPHAFETFTLFGDGAAAAIIEATEEDCGILTSRFETWEEGALHTIFPGGGLKNFYRDHPYDPVFFSFHMDGMKLLKLARKTLPAFVEHLFQGTGLQMADMDLIIPHQASKAGLALFRADFNLPESQLHNTLDTFGNCIAASIPITLCDAVRKGRVERGDTLLLIGSAAGFTLGGMVLKY